MNPFLSLSYTLFNLELVGRHFKYVHLKKITNSFVTFFFCCICLTKHKLRIALWVHMFGIVQNWNTPVGAFRKSRSILSNASVLLSRHSCFPNLLLPPAFSEAISQHPSLSSSLHHHFIVWLHVSDRTQYKRPWMGSFLALWHVSPYLFTFYLILFATSMNSRFILLQPIQGHQFNHFSLSYGFLTFALILDSRSPVCSSLSSL